MTIRLITKTDDLAVSPTDYREVDAKTALTRGLAEYVETLVVNAPGGRKLKFANVLDHYAEPDEKAQFPSAAIYATADGVYDASEFTPQTPNVRNHVSDDLYLIKSCELVQPIIFEVWANDVEQRLALVMGLEELLNPVDWRYGFVVELPFYFNERAVYAVQSMTYPDSEAEAIKRYRRAVYAVMASIPVCNVRRYPLAQTKLVVDVE